jgi:hypothetical protein
MNSEANRIIDALGGTTAVSRLLEIPLSTVHSWRSNGVPPSRMAHLKLAAAVAGKAAELDQAMGSPGAATTAAENHVGSDTSCPARIETGKFGEVSCQVGAA